MWGILKLTMVFINCFEINLAEEIIRAEK